MILPLLLLMMRDGRIVLVRLLLRFFLLFVFTLVETFAPEKRNAPPRPPSRRDLRFFVRFRFVRRSFPNSHAPPRSAPLRPPRPSPPAVLYVYRTHREKKVTGGISPNRRGWVGPFAGKLTTEEERDRHKVVTDAVHSVRIPTYSGSGGGGTTAAAAAVPMPPPSRDGYACRYSTPDGTRTTPSRYRRRPRRVRYRPSPRGDCRRREYDRRYATTRIAPHWRGGQGTTASKSWDRRGT